MWYKTFLLVSSALAVLAVAAVPALAQEVEALRGANPPTNAIWLDSLDLRGMSQSYASPRAGKSVDSNPMKLKGAVYSHGVGTHANSELIIELKRSAEKFVSVVGVDDERIGLGSITFEVWVDGKKVADSGVMRGGDEPKLLSVDLKGAKNLQLRVTDADGDISNDHADWAGAAIILAANAKEKPVVFGEFEDIPLPVASTSFTKLGIHGPRIAGTTPGSDFIFRIPATGKAPLSFSAKGLPDGLKLEPRTGVISGSLAEAGEYIVTLSVKDSTGTASRKLKIVGGEHKLALTPPLGWNSWNVWACAVDDAKVRAAADSMVKSGLASFGFQYVNIDDCWEGKRDANGEILTNEKFPDMSALSDYVHSKGLRLGIYSSPGPRTCAGYEACWQHEQQDADTYAKWGVDYLKYDWCSYGSVVQAKTREDFQKPYRVMRTALDNCGRDIVYSLCQYGMDNVWEWGTEVGGNCWRTTGDINDSWGSLSGIAFSQDGHEKFIGPGHWNDPDMLVVGKVGWGPNLHPSNLTHNEQILHITAWSLLSSPLLIGCDMSDMDKFTLDLLTNEEVLNVNQDPLGKPAGRVAQVGQTEVWARPLWDGTVAVGLFNKGPWKADVTANWADIGVDGKQPVRNLWRKKAVGVFDDSLTISVPGHGAIMLKIGKPNRTDW